MTKSSDALEPRSDSCAWGCAALLGFFLAWMLLDSQIFSSLSMLGLALITLVAGLRQGQLGSVRREARPLAFWSWIALAAAVGAAAFYRLVDRALEL